MKNLITALALSTFCFPLSALAQSTGASAIPKKKSTAGFENEYPVIGNSQILLRKADGTLTGGILGTGLTLTGATLSASGGAGALEIGVSTVASSTGDYVIGVASGTLMEFPYETIATGLGLQNGAYSQYGTDEFQLLRWAANTNTDPVTQALGATDLGAVKRVAALPIAAGGTNAETANAALNNLLPSQTGSAGRALVTDGTNTSFDLIDLNTGVQGLLDIASLADGSITNAKLANSTITINGSSVSLGDSTTISAGSTSIDIDAAEMIPRTTNPPGVGGGETATNHINYDSWDFDKDSAEYVQKWLVMPSNYSGGTVTVKFIWTAASGSGDVVWSASARAFSDGDTLDTSTGTAQTVTDTFVSGKVHITGASSAITISGSPAAGVPVLFEFSRSAANGSDTLSADAKLLRVLISF